MFWQLGCGHRLFGLLQSLCNLVLIGHRRISLLANDKLVIIGKQRRLRASPCLASGCRQSESHASPAFSFDRNQTSPVPQEPDGGERERERDEGSVGCLQFRSSLPPLDRAQGIIACPSGRVHSRV